MDKERAAYLLNRYHSGACTPEEHAEFALLLHHPRFEALRNELLDDHWPREADADWRQAAPAGYWNVLAAIKAVPRAAQPRGLRRWLPYAAAAVAVLVAVGWLLLGGLRQQPSENRLATTEILPGGNRATLTLADGRTISLSEAQQGIIVGNELSYTDGSEVLDAGTESLTSHVSHLMSLKTPKGGTYQITLPDGTKVWLNAASTLKYPSHFSRTARVVEVSGEAYFDVEKKDIPFRVRSKGQEVEVLGTEFNISAYPDETEAQTTLVEGSVRLALAASPGTRRSENVLTLVPGEQGRFQKGVLTKAIADVRSVTAWKDGRFAFTGKSFSQVMDEFSRWYDVDIRYDGKVPDEPLIGGAYRTDDFRTVLRLLESGGIAYRLEGRTLIINPKEEETH